MEKPDVCSEFNQIANWTGAGTSGGRFVFFEACVSFVVFTMRWPSSIRYIPPGRSAWIEGLPLTILTVLLGWWGLPWGIIYTPLVLARNLAGGCDVTGEVLARIDGKQRESS
jgi:hypothetical protein